MEKRLNYSEAIAEVEKILARLNGDQIDVDSLGEQVRRATDLIKECKSKLVKAEKEIDEVLKA